MPMILPVVVDRIHTKLTMWYYRLRSPFIAWLWGVRHGRNLIFQGKTIIRTRRQGEIIIGDNVVFNSQRITNLVGLLGPTILDTLGGGKIEITTISILWNQTLGEHWKIVGISALSLLS